KKAGPTQTRHVGDARRMADGGRIRDERWKLQRDPVRTRRTDLQRPQSQHARPRRDPTMSVTFALADRGGPKSRHRQAGIRAPDVAGSACRGGGWIADRDPPRPGSRDVRRGPVARLRGVSETTGTTSISGEVVWEIIVALTPRGRFAFLSRA